MSFALPTLVVFLLLLPGFTARSRIKRVERQVLDYSPFGQVVTEALMWAVVLHALALGLCALIGTHTPRLDWLLMLFATDAATQTQTLRSVAGEAPAVALYFAGLLAASYALPAAVRRAVVARRLDRLGSPWSPLLRFSGAPWYYLLSAADFAEEDQPDLIAVSALVNVAGEAWLFMGLLSDYFLTPEGQLDRLVLQRVRRRPLGRDKASSEDPEEAERFYPVDGDYFVLRYAEAITLNVEYIRLDLGDPRDEAAGADQPA